MKGIPTLWKLRKEGELNNNHVAFYFYLRHLDEDRDGKIIVSTRELCAAMDTERRSLMYWLKKLEDCQLIQRDNGSKGKRRIVIRLSTGKENKKTSNKNKATNKEGVQQNAQVKDSPTCATTCATESTSFLHTFEDNSTELNDNQKPSSSLDRYSPTENTFIGEGGAPFGVAAPSPYSEDQEQEKIPEQESITGLSDRLIAAMKEGS